MKDNYYEEDFNKNIKKLTNIRKNNKSSLVKNNIKWYNKYRENELGGCVVPLPVSNLGVRNIGWLAKTTLPFK